MQVKNGKNGGLTWANRYNYLAGHNNQCMAEDTAKHDFLQCEVRAKIILN